MNVNDVLPTVTSLSLVLVTLTVTVSVGSDSRTTVYAALPPSSTVNAVGATSTPAHRHP